MSRAKSQTETEATSHRTSNCTPIAAHTAAADETAAAEEVASTTAASIAAAERRHRSHSPVGEKNSYFDLDPTNVHHHDRVVAPAKRDEYLREQVSKKTSWAKKS